jgi:diguanylate cyclase (GGDEF)-like protein
MVYSEFMRIYSNRALWRTYIFIVGFSVVVAGAFLLLKWQDVKHDATNQQNYSNKLIAHSISNYLNKYETFLHVVGEYLLNELPESGSVQPKSFITKQMQNNREVVSVQLADAQGKILRLIGGFRTNQTVDFGRGKDNSIVLDELKKTFGIVMGRTYYMPSLDDWLIPLSVSLKNDRNEVEGIISIDLKYSQIHENWFGGDAHYQNVRRLLFRDDLYRQYASFIEKDAYADWLTNPLSKDRYDLVMSLLEFQLGVTESELLRGKEQFTFTVPDKEGLLNLATIYYNPKFGLYTISAIAYSELIARIFSASFWLILLLIVFNIGLYLLFRAISRREGEAKASLQYQVEHDPLTKLPNRRYLLNHFQAWSNSHSREHSLLYLDLNNFKTCNDIHGHSTGDKILCAAADRLVEFFKDSLCARQGGDEFIVLCPVTNQSVLLQNCEDFAKALAKTIHVEHLEFSIYASIGISFAPCDGQTLDELLRKADMAMYEAKSKSRTIGFYTEELETKTRQASDIERELSSALKNNEFTVVYQPQVDAYSYHVLGVEALLRWNNPTLGFVPPDVFIPVAESSGLINEIGRFVMEQALKDGYEVSKICNLKHKLRVSVNLSVSQLFNDDFIEHLQGLLAHYQGQEVTFMLEVTESLFIDDLIRAKNILEQVKFCGVFISLDDFGTGYSSLSVLSKLPINELKIDRSFVNDILTDENDWLLAKSIIYLCKSLSIPVVAEGVENKAQADRLAAHGCDVFQGYYFARPMPKENLIEFLNNKKDMKQA